MRPSPWVRGSLNRRCSSSRRRIMTLPIQRSVSQATARNSSTNSTTRMSAEFTMVPRAWCPVAGDFRRSVAYLPSPSRLLEGTAAYASSPCFLGCGSKFHSERKTPFLRAFSYPRIGSSDCCRSLMTSRMSSQVLATESKPWDFKFLTRSSALVSASSPYCPIISSAARAI